MDAFRATLEEVTADALLHVGSVSSRLAKSTSFSDGILSEMPVTPGPALVALNKIDQVDSDTLALAQKSFPRRCLFRLALAWV